MRENDHHGPLLIEDAPGAEEASPAEAPPVPETEGPPHDAGRAMAGAAALAARRMSAPARWALRLGAALFTFLLGVAAWEALAALLAANPVLGWIGTVLAAGFLLACLWLIARELAALARLNRLDRLHRDAAAALAAGDIRAGREVVARVSALYAGREALAAPRARLGPMAEDGFDVDGLYSMTEQVLLAPLDQAARREVEGAARQVATVTAVVPLALADVAAALTGNLRMIRRIAEIYGGRGGALGAWRLTRAVMAHLVATGAVAVGDDLIGSVAGGSVLSRVSRRFGEGVVNGALTARVGIAAMEVCRPLPFTEATRPQVHRLVGRALTGLFGGKESG